MLSFRLDFAADNLEFLYSCEKNNEIKRDVYLILSVKSSHNVNGEVYDSCKITDVQQLIFAKSRIADVEKTSAKIMCAKNVTESLVYFS